MVAEMAEKYADKRTGDGDRQAVQQVGAQGHADEGQHVDLGKIRHARQQHGE
jgi:hypothetical protein